MILEERYYPHLDLQQREPHAWKRCEIVIMRVAIVRVGYLIADLTTSYLRQAYRIGTAAFA